MYCNNCGAEISEGNSFCTNCGEAITGQNRYENELQQQNTENLTYQNQVDYNETYGTEDTDKNSSDNASGNSSFILTIIIALCLLLIFFTIFNILVTDNTIGNNSNFIRNYRDGLSDILTNIGIDITTEEETKNTSKTKTTVKSEPTTFADTKPNRTTTENIVESTTNKQYYFSNLSVGDTVTFGSYEQDNNFENGDEAIEWVVLDVQDGKALLLSKYELFSSAYNDTQSDVTWETCTLRSKLNGDFYNTAFTGAEKQAVLSTTVTADDNPKQNTNPGNNTTDKVFLLSINEVNKYFDTTDSNEAHGCPTEYAISTGVDVQYETGGTGAWWLRTPGKVQAMCAIVGNDGLVYTGGDYVDYAVDGVRPAIWVEAE